MAQNTAKLGSWKLDHTTGNLTWSNQTFKIFEIDYTLFEASYEAFLKTIHPEDIKKVNQAYQNSLKNKEAYETEHRLLMKDGRVKWVRERFDTSFDKEGKPLKSIGTVQDITAYKLLQNRLDRERVKYKSLMKNASEAIMVANMQGGIVETNKRASDILGYSSEEFLQFHIKDIEALHSEEEIAKNIEKVYYEPLNFETKYRKKDKTLIDVSLKIVTVMIDNDEYIYASFRDITEQKRLSLALEERENELQVILENIPSMIFIKDAKELRFVHLNKAGEEFLGVDEADMLGKNDYDFFSKEQADFFTNKDKEVISSNKILDIKEEFITTQNGIKILHTKKVAIKDKDGKPKYLLGISEDITEQKAIAKELEELNFNLEKKIKERTEELEVQKDSFQTLFEDSSDGLVLLQNRKFIECNKTVLKMMGYPNKEEFLHLHPAQMSPKYQPDGKESQKKVEEMIEICIERGYNEFDWMHTKYDGRNFWCKIALNKIIFNNQETIYIRWRDIDREKELEIQNEKYMKELIEAKNQAEALSKIKSSFLANMSHEIRTPMNGIIGMSHLALKSSLSQKQKNYITKIYTSAQVLLNIINDILDISKIEAGKLEIEKANFELFKVIESVINIIELKANEKNLTLRVEYESRLGKVFYGDSLRINQILLNLLGNAVKFTDKGVIGLTVTKEADDRVRFEIEDSGIGLSKEQTSKLFKSFSQADSSITKRYGGTGLGLAISKELVKLMEGRIWVESELGKGSKFFFEIKLPQKDEKSLVKNFNSDTNEIVYDELLVANTNTLQREMQKLKGSKILLAEDNETNQELILGLLEESGIKIDVVSNGLEAIEKFKRGSYELILMDIQMPLLDGYKATKEIRAMDSTIPIVALTANAMKEDIQKTKSLGMNEHLKKPIDVEKLYKTLLRFIPKKIKLTDTKLYNDKESHQLLEFNTFDSQYGLNLILGNVKAFKHILLGVVKYKSINYEDMSDEELKMSFHSLKGLTASAGALELSKIASEIEETLNREKISKFQEKLLVIIDEIEEKLINTQIKKEKKKLLKTTRDTLFAKLKEAIKTKRVKKCKPIIQELEEYQLNQKDSEFFEEIKSLIDKFKFKNAIELFDR